MRTLTSTNPIRWKGKTLFLLSVMLFFCCIGCDKKERPEFLFGKWITDNPAYADCGLEITKDWIVFSKGLTHKLFYSVTKIEDITSRDSDKTLYSIYYEDEDGYEYTLSLFYYHTEEGDVLQFKHQKQLLWKRDVVS